MKTYIDCGSGVAGDMLLGAMIGLGVRPKELETVLRRAIPLKGWRLNVQPVERAMWPAWSLRVVGDRSFPSIDKMRTIMKKAPLPAPAKRLSLNILKALEKAEHEAHGHSHGVFDGRGLGRIDTLVDIMGNAWSAWRLGLRDITASSLNTGRIAPATLKLLVKAKVPIYTDSPLQELATPTGVAILTHLATSFGPLAVQQVSNAGFGAGTLERKGKPNVLAIYQGISSRKLLKYRT